MYVCVLLHYHLTIENEVLFIIIFTFSALFPDRNAKMNNMIMIQIQNDNNNTYTRS